MPIDNLRTEITESKPRNEKGQFIKIPQYSEDMNPAEKFLISHTGNYKDQEDLLDIHIGNPLRRVVELLEEIKKQKAFSFTIKGSLGIAGVVLAVSVFGVFSGDKLLCEKGVQSQVGVIRTLNFKEVYSQKVPVISYLLELMAPSQKLIKHRVVLVKLDNSTVHIPFNENFNPSNFENQTVIATGSYNSCSDTLTVEDDTAIDEL